MSESVLKKFGKYFLLDRIGEGGMAEIFRARLATPDGGGRFVVIKRVQGAYTNNQEFMQMFRSEVQVTMRFTHPNIVQLYEAGEEGGQQYIAMELVDGRNLRQILSRVSQKQQRIPIAAACQMVEQAALGLNYAHHFKDRITGEPLNLVHRDVSPQNILISYDGNIKVIDFGIAKATTNGESTRAGVIKGKLSYLSPEQVMGDHLDGRSDLFALGIVLWELLTAKRLFVAEGDNEFQVLKMIESCNTFVKPPSQINPEIPKELDAIVLQALARDPAKRFQTGEEFARSLRKVLNQYYQDFSAAELSTFVKKLFHDMIVEDRKQLQQLNARAEELIALVAKEPSPELLKIQSHPEGVDRTHVKNLGNKFDRSQISEAPKVELAVTPERQMKVPVNRVDSKVSAPQPKPVLNPKSRTDIRSPVPLPEKSANSFGRFLLLAGAAAGVAGYIYVQENTKTNPTEVERSVATESQTTKDSNHAQALLKLRLFPDGKLEGVHASINSEPYDFKSGFMKVAVGELLEVHVDRPGFINYRKEFTIKPHELNEAGEFDLSVKLEPMVFGTFTLSTQPEIADVTIVSIDQGGNDLKPVVLRTPIYQEKLPVGHYQVTVKNDALGVERSFQIEIKEGDRIVKNSIPLEPTRLPANKR